MTTTEVTAHTEERARRLRRVCIQEDQEVSLIAYDPERDLYTFDVYE